jgi:nicotinate-nucleotide pyrophosphorylase (carboxylating)
VATLTRRYVDAIARTKAAVYDTRKTTPGWRRLEKYAVRMGGGRNHRTGLFDAILIKDNHLALGAAPAGQGGAAARPYSPAEAVGIAKRFLAGLPATSPHAGMIVEVEVDTLTQFADAVSSGADIVLLDNMSLDDLRFAVAQRSELRPQLQLEASGGVTLSTIRAIAETGVDRISVGALTHSAEWFDVGLDWEASD